MGPAEAVRALARRHGVQLAYRDVDGVTRRAGTEPLCAVLRALGEPVDRPKSALALLHREQEAGRAAIEPVYVAWGGRLPAFEIELPGTGGRPVQVELVLEDGAGAPCDIVRRASTPAGGSRWRVHAPLPEGYHRRRIGHGAGVWRR